MSWGVVPDGAGCGRARSQPGPAGAARPPGRRDRSSSASRSVRFRTEIGSGEIAVRRRTEDDREAAKQAGCGPSFHSLGQARLGMPGRDRVIPRIAPRPWEWLRPVYPES